MAMTTTPDHTARLQVARARRIELEEEARLIEARAVHNAHNAGLSLAAIGRALGIPKRSTMHSAWKAGRWDLPESEMAALDRSRHTIKAQPPKRT